MISDLQQQLGIDASFFPQFITFLFLFVWLKFAFFSPYLKLIKKRENQSEGLSEETAKLEEESDRLEKKTAEEMLGVRKRAAQEREKILLVARQEGGATVAAARERAKKGVEAARLEAQAVERADIEGLRTQVGAVSALLVEKLTKSKVGL